MSETNLFFTVVIPVYNGELTIQAAMTSVLNQTYTNLEILIVDGCSSDKTISIIKTYASTDKRIKWISEKDTGVYDAMNKGIAMAKGKWLYFLGSDDYLVDKDILSKLHTFLNEHPEANLTYGNVTSAYLGEKYDGPFDKMKLTRKNLCHQAIFYKKTLFDLIGNYNLRYKVNSDWEFNLRCFFHPKVNTCYIDQVIAYFSGGGLSHRLGDPLFHAEWNQLVARIGYRSMPLKSLKTFCRSNLEFGQFLLRRIYCRFGKQ